MTETNFEKRDERGEWYPYIITSTPLYHWPLRPILIFKWLFGYPGYLLPWTAFFMILPLITWFFLTPDLTIMKNFEIGWIATVYFRNLALLILIAGGFHFRLYIKKKQGILYKYNQNWLLTNHRGFLFKDQTWDNIFWSTTSGCGIWTAFEVLTYWLYANGIIRYLEYQSSPVYFVLLYLAIHPIREVHFYFTHRLLHWKPLYKKAHYLHHKNVNIGPWSGLAMHPIEHLLYFTGVVLHWISLSHPLHATFHLQHAALTAPWGHIGFENIVLKENFKIPRSSDFFHYLHHRYFECNFGGLAIPFDEWFGTFHNGSREANKAFRKRHKEYQKA